MRELDKIDKEILSEYTKKLDDNHEDWVCNIHYDIYQKVYLLIVSDGYNYSFEHLVEETEIDMLISKSKIKNNIKDF